MFGFFKPRVRRVENNVNQAIFQNLDANLVGEFLQEYHKTPVKTEQPANHKPSFRSVNGVVTDRRS